MSGGGGQTTNTVQNADPWSGLQPYLTDLYGQTQNLVNQGATPFYPQNTYAGFTDPQLLGQYGALDYADSLNMSPLFSAQNQALSGYNPLQAAMLPSMYQAGNTYGDVMNRTGYGDIWGQMGDTQATQALLGQMNNPGAALANPYGQALQGMTNPQGNPYLDQMVNQALTSVTDVYNRDVLSGLRDEAILSGQDLGPEGSTFMRSQNQAQQNLLDTMGDIATNAYGSQYQSDMNRALAASQQGTNLWASGLGRNLTAAQTGIGAEMQAGQMGINAQQALDAARMAAAGGSVSGYGQGLDIGSGLLGQGLALAPQTYQTGLLPSQIYQDIGGQQQAMDQNAINQAMQAWYYPQQSQQDLLSWYTSQLGGIPVPNSGSSTSYSDIATNPYLGALGGGMLGYGLGSLGWLGMSNPYTALLGAGLGYLSSR